MIFVTNIGDNLVKDLQKQNPLQQHNGFKNYCDPSLQNSMFCTPISKTELESLINKMKNGKSPGHDNYWSQNAQGKCISFIWSSILHI